MKIIEIKRNIPLAAIINDDGKFRFIHPSKLDPDLVKAHREEVRAESKDGQS